MTNLGTNHTKEILAEFKELIWACIRKNLKTEGISIMNNAFPDTNRYEHSGAHIYTYKSAVKELLLNDKVDANFKAELQGKDPKHNPAYFEKHWIYVSTNIFTGLSLISVDREEENSEGTFIVRDWRVRILEQAYNKENYILVFRPYDNFIAFHKMKDLKIENREGKFLNSASNYYELSGLQFKPYFLLLRRKRNEKAFENFKPEYLGNWHGNDKQYRGNYKVWVCDENNICKKELRASSWRQFETMTNKQLKANTLQRAYKLGREMIQLTKDGTKLNIWIGDNMEETLEQKVARYLNKVQKNKVIDETDSGKIQTVKGYLRTLGWTTLTDKKTAEEFLNVDNAKDTQVCVNKPLSKRACRKNDEVHKQNFLFECDETSLKRQVQIINNLSDEFKKAILWACYSGSKSIHVVVKTDMPDDATRDERKYIHSCLNSMFFEGKADPSGQNAARLARNPNAVRENGRVQKAFLINDDNAEAFSVKDMLNEYREEKRALENKLKYVRINTGDTMRVHTLQSLRDWNRYKPSKAKQECIEYLEGTGNDWSRSAAVARTLFNWGWSVDDILSECLTYDDKWIKAAVKILH